jgi:two-component system response regulator HydG
MKRIKILIVEDDVFSRGAMEKILESYDYETSSCATAEEAITRLKQESFNILITDLHMPGMDGFELIRNAKMIQPGLLIIMITGFPAEEVKCKAQQKKLDGFFSKPINWDELHTLLDTLSGSERVQNSGKGIGLY